jgi:hypothetical protein
MLHSFILEILESNKSITTTILGRNSQIAYQMGSNLGTKARNRPWPLPRLTTRPRQSLQLKNTERRKLRGSSQLPRRSRRWTVAGAFRSGMPASNLIAVFNLRRAAREGGQSILGFGTLILRHPVMHCPGFCIVRSR